MYPYENIYVVYSVCRYPFAVDEQRWEVVFGNPDIIDPPVSLVNSYDGGNLLCGHNELHQGTMYKTDKNGKVLWSTFFKGDHPTPASIGEDCDGNKVIAGSMYANAWVVFLNSCNDLVWCSEYFNAVEYSRSFFTDVLLVDSLILAVGNFKDFDNNYSVNLLAFDYDGYLLWNKVLASPISDTLLNMPLPVYLEKVNNSYFVSGDCYYAYPSNPNVGHLRSMFIKLDSLFNKEWFLPYGMSYYIGGTAMGVIPLDSVNFRGYGSYSVAPNVMNSIFMDFDADGNEIGYKGIPNSSISSEVEDNELRALNIIDDSTYLITAAVGDIPYEVNPIGEWTMDTGGYVYNYQNHPGAKCALRPTVKTEDGQFVFLAKKENTNLDIMLYKLNPDLSQAEIDTNTYNYDSLCDELPIVSDTIYLDNCSIVTSIDEVPTPSEYYASLKTININVMPNPATNNIVFEVENTDYHNNIVLTCYNANGKKVFEQLIQQNQAAVKANVTNWQSGMYVVIARSSNGGYGSSKFVVK